MERLLQHQRNLQQDISKINCNLSKRRKNIHTHIHTHTYMQKAVIGHGKKKCFKICCVCFPFAQKCEAEKQRRSPKVTRSSVFYDLIWENCCQKKKKLRKNRQQHMVGSRGEGGEVKGRETVPREQHNRTFKRQILSLSSLPSLYPAVVEPLLLPHSTSPMGQQVWTVASASCCCHVIANSVDVAKSIKTGN